jgi:hypothetical protein
MSHEVDKTNQQPLSVIVGSQLSSVEFVQDYLQLRFDGPCLTAVTHPRVRVGNTWFTWGDPWYRNQLCERISSIVHKASVREDQEICLDFDDGSHLSISLRPEDYRAAEAAMFNDGQDGWWVW